MGFVKAERMGSTGTRFFGVSVQFRGRGNCTFLGIRPSSSVWKRAGIDPKTQRVDVYIDDERARVRICPNEEGEFRATKNGQVTVTISDTEKYPFLNTAYPSNKTHRADPETVKVREGSIEFDVPGECWE